MIFATFLVYLSYAILFGFATVCLGAFAAWRCNGRQRCHAHALSARTSMRSVLHCGIGRGVHNDHQKGAALHHCGETRRGRAARHRLTQRARQTVVALHFLGWLLEDLPKSCLAVGLVAHAVYFSLLQRFPFIALSDPKFIASVVLLVANHSIWCARLCAHKSVVMFSCRVPSL